MNKNILTLLGAVTACIAIGFVILSDDTIESAAIPAHNTVETGNINAHTKNIQIHYVASQHPSSSDAHQSDPITDTVKKEPHDPTLKYQTFDASGTYRLSLVDPEDLSTDATDFQSFHGTIDGAKYSINVPIKSLKNDTLRLKVENIKTKEIKEVSLPFTYDMQSIGASPKVDFTYDNIENYEVNFPSQADSPFPVLPGQ